jgi:hypothetical protein
MALTDSAFRLLDSHGLTIKDAETLLTTATIKHFQNLAVAACHYKLQYPFSIYSLTVVIDVNSTGSFC